MSQALQNTKWLWCLLILNIGPLSPVASVTVKTSPISNGPAAVEAQAKFFQDFFSVQLSPYKIEFGHVCEDPNTWEQRYEAKDFKNHRDMGKVRWGDKKGGYGEHYWDLNHAGHADNHGDDRYGSDDDGSYHEHNDDSSSNNDPYDEPSEQSPSYDSEYDAEKASKYDDSNRAKRHPKHYQEDEDPIVDIPKIKPRRQRKQQKPQQEEYEYESTTVEPKKPKHKRQHKPVVIDEDEDEEEEKPEATEKPAIKEQSQYVTKRPEKSFVPYESGAGLRQHQQASLNDYTAAASIPRLFLEPSTGHVVDRTTGQAYVLQPIVNYN